MPLKTIESICLDFYTKNIVIVNAKQYDEKTRYVNITCTDHGKTVFMDSNKVTAFICGKKIDGKYIFNYANVLEDGTILAELTPQILSVEGKHVFEIILMAKSSITDEELNQVEDFKELYILENVNIISVMPFYVNTMESVDKSEIMSSSEYNALLENILFVSNLEKAIRLAEEKRVDAENNREDAEEKRVSNENDRQTSELNREKIFGDSDDTVDDRTMYGVMNSTLNIYNETNELLGDSDDEASLDTLYGIYKMSVNSEKERQNKFDELSEDCQEAIDNANKVAKDCESLLNYATATTEEVKAYLNI